MPLPSAFSLGLKDLLQGLASVHVWSFLGWQEIKQRYRRSVLGPFWLTISTGVLIGAMGPLYGKLLGQQVGDYFLYFAVGFVVWQLIAAIISDSTQVFIAAEQYIKNIKLPFTVHILRMVWKNAIIFAHNFVIVALVLLYFLPSWHWQILLVIPGILAFLINAVWVGILLGLVCARFRDIPPIITSFVQLAFFITPVIWSTPMLGRHKWAAQWNPFFHFLEVVRAPLLGTVPSGLSWIVVLAVTLAGFAVSLALFSRFRSRIAYWV